SKTLEAISLLTLSWAWFFCFNSVLIFSNAKIRAVREGSKVLCYSGGGGGVSVVVVAVVVVMIGCYTVEETGFGGDRSITGMDIGGTEDEAWWIGTVTSD
ncbi:hypothetical protein Tco_0030331, partial [Tanacetum coccineum]